MVNGKLTMVPMVPGLPETKVVHGLALMVQLLADGTLTQTVSSLEPGGAMTITKEEPGRQKIHHLISKLPQSLSISLLAIGPFMMS